MMLPLLLVVFAACQPATMELTDEQKAEIEQSVRAAVLEAWASWYDQADIDDYVSHHSDWAGSPWGCSGCETLEGLGTAVQDYWNQWDIDSHEDGEVDVMVLGPDAAAAKIISNIAMTDTAGVHREWQYNQAMLMVRENGQWKLMVAKNAGRRTDME
jgi:hypothetical protein